MSELKVTVEKIETINPIPGADFLELAGILGWQCVVGKGTYKPGDLAVYIPIDSVLPQELEEKIFPPGSKVKLHNHRIKTIKLKGAISQGLVISLALANAVGKKEGTELTEKLGVTKYEPPKRLSANSNSAAASKKQVNPNFRKYTDIQNFKNYPKLFEEGELVIGREKVHGTNFRAGYVEFHASTLLKKIKKFFGLAPKYEFVYGSHNVQLQDKVLNRGYIAKSVYAEAVEKYGLREKLVPGEVLFAEIYGDGIQKGWAYDCKTGERKIAAFDIMMNGKYLDEPSFSARAESLALPVAPVIFLGPFNTEAVKKVSMGDSVIAPGQKIREGVVLKPQTDQLSYMGRKVLKLISDEYLIKKGKLEEKAAAEGDESEEFSH